MIWVWESSGGVLQGLWESGGMWPCPSGVPGEGVLESWTGHVGWIGVDVLGVDGMVTRGGGGALLGGDGERLEKDDLTKATPLEE